MHPSPSLLLASAAAAMLLVMTLSPAAAAPPRDQRHALQVLSEILDGDSSAGAEGGGGAVGGDLGDTDEELGELVGDLVGELGATGAGLALPPAPRASRDLAGGEMEPVSSGVWLRLFNDFVSNQRRFKGRTKKGPGKGCFGGKLDRIGALSGLGC